MLKVAREVVYTYNKTVCYISVDYAALRVVLVKDSLPLYSHTFRSPIIEAIDIVSQDRQMSIPDALNYIKQLGINSEYNFNNPTAMRRIEALREDIMADVVHNINLVAMSLDLTIDQAVLSDFVGFSLMLQVLLKSLVSAKMLMLLPISLTQNGFAGA